MAEGAGPLVDAVWESFQFPAVSVVVDVVVSAERSQFPPCGVLGGLPGDFVVDVTFGEVDAASGPDTFGLDCL